MLTSVRGATDLIPVRGAMLTSSTSSLPADGYGGSEGGRVGAREGDRKKGREGGIKRGCEVRNDEELIV